MWDNSKTFAWSIGGWKGLKRKAFTTSEWENKSYVNSNSFNLSNII